ncbi:MAG: aminotransferase class III-fold pyridoxal phosphate-dependent enzyme [Candidatus Omnitrophota bacterium]
MAGSDFIRTPQSVPLIRTKYRRIRTMIPAPGSLSILNDLEKYESRSMHGQMPVVWDKAEGFSVFDACGNQWIDFTSTIFVANAGHSNPGVIRAIRGQLDRKLLHTYVFASGVRAKFLKKLIESTPKQFQKAFLLSAGTEATECALKLMRMHGRTIRKSKLAVISFRGAMHGRTMAAEMLKGNPGTASWIGYSDPNIYHLPVPYPWAAPASKKNYDWGRHFERDMNALKKNGLDFRDIAGFMIESYLGWGAIFYPREYIQRMAEFAARFNGLLAFDDIQGGFGRTGKLFAYQHYGVKPDLLCLGKAMSGSLPLSAVIGPSSIMDLPGTGSMSSTHSANPLSCAAGLATLYAIEEGGLVKESYRKGKILHSFLNALKSRYSDRIGYVFGKGMLAGVIFKDPAEGKPDSSFPTKVCERAMQKGLLLVHTGRESIKIGPPLMIPDDALLEGLRVLEESMEEIIAEGTP